MLESLVTAFFKFLADIVGEIVLAYSPARLIRRVFFGAPFSDEGEGWLTMVWRGLWDLFSWAIVIALVLKALGKW